MHERSASCAAASGAAVDVDARDRRLAAVEDDVLGLLDVDPGLLQAVEDRGEDADAVVVAHRDEVGRERLLREVHDVRGAARLLVEADDADGLCGDGLLRLLGRGADVVGADDAGEGEDRRVDRAAAARGLLGEDVEPRAEAALLDGALEGGLVDDLGARRVQEERAVLHRGEDAVADETARRRCEREVHGERVGRGRDLGDRRLRHDAELGGERRVERSAPRDDVHPERARPRDDLAPDRPRAEHAERAAVEPARLAVVLLVPAARAEVHRRVDDVTVEREQERERELGHGDGVLAGAVGDPDAALAGGLHVDRVDSGAGADDQRELARLEHRPRHLRRAHDEDVGARPRDRREQIVAARVRLVDDLAADLREPAPPRVLELVRDEHLHARSIVQRSAPFHDATRAARWLGASAGSDPLEVHSMSISGRAWVSSTVT